MSDDEDTAQQNPGRQQDSDSDPRRAGQIPEKPEPDDSARQKAKEMAKAYDDIETAVLPGSGRTVTGTAVNEWLDDDGNPKYGKADKADNADKADGTSDAGSPTDG